MGLRDIGSHCERVKICRRKRKYRAEEMGNGESKHNQLQSKDLVGKASPNPYNSPKKEVGKLSFKSTLNRDKTSHAIVLPCT